MWQGRTDCATPGPWAHPCREGILAHWQDKTIGRICTPAHTSCWGPPDPDQRPVPPWGDVLHRHTVLNTPANPVGMIHFNPPPRPQAPHDRHMPIRNTGACPEHQHTPRLWPVATLVMAPGFPPPAGSPPPQVDPTHLPRIRRTLHRPMVGSDRAACSESEADTQGQHLLPAVPHLPSLHDSPAFLHGPPHALPILARHQPNRTLRLNLVPAQRNITGTGIR